MKREPFSSLEAHGPIRRTAWSGHDLKAWLYGIATACGVGLGAYTMYSEPNRAHEHAPYVFILVAFFGAVTLYHAWLGSREAEARDVVAAPTEVLADEACVLHGNPHVHVRLGLLALALVPAVCFLLDGTRRWLAIALASLGASANLWRAWRMPRGGVVFVDRSGIRDVRSRAGRIDWDAIERLYVQRLYGSSFLCLVLKNPRAISGTSRLNRWMGAGDIVISLVGLYPGPGTRRTRAPELSFGFLHSRVLSDNKFRLERTVPSGHSVS